jgi:hypothetical protein
VFSVSRIKLSIPVMPTNGVRVLDGWQKVYPDPVPINTLPASCAGLPYPCHSYRVDPPVPLEMYIDFQSCDPPEG